MKHITLVRFLSMAAFLVTAVSANAKDPDCEVQVAGEHGNNGGIWRVVATDHGYDVPACIPAGLRHFVFENRGSEIHEAMFIKLPEDMSADQYLAAVQSGIDFPKGALDYSGPGLTSPGHRVDIWLRLDPGRYLLFCWFRGHSSTLPAHEIRVVDDSTPDSTVPEADIVIRQMDFRFEIEGGFQAGQQVIQFLTPGPSMHEADIFRLKDGMDIDDLRRWQQNAKQGPAPATAHGGVLDNHDIRRPVWLETDLPRGRYVLWCNMPMTADNTASSSTVTHADLGMFRQFVIQ